MVIYDDTRKKKMMVAGGKGDGSHRCKERKALETNEVKHAIVTLMHEEDEKGESEGVAGRR